MYVLKFGGSSVADSKCMLNVVDILRKRNNEKILLVLSACQGITNKLEQVSSEALNNNKENSKVLCDEIRSLHLNIINYTLKNSRIKRNACYKVNTLCDELENLLVGVSLLKELIPQVMDRIYAFGECLSTNIFYYIALEHGLKIIWKDARNFIKTDSNFLSANILEQQTKEHCKELYKEFNNYDIIVTQGFIGSDEFGHTTTLGRGGSDLSAAVFGNAMSAECIEIWTDVNGVLSADPRLISEAKSIPVMRYTTVKEMAFWGAKVLHPKTILPAIKNNIPVKILNSFEPENQGTIIESELYSNSTSVHSIVVKQKCSMLSIAIDESSKYIEVLTSVIKYLSENDFHLLYSVYSNQSISLIVDGELNDVIIDNKTIYRSIVNAICIVGENFTNNIEEFSKITNSINYCLINNHSKLLGMHIISKHTILLIIDSSNINMLVKDIHQKLI